MLYHANRRATQKGFLEEGFPEEGYSEEDYPEEDRPEDTIRGAVSSAVEAGTFAPDEIRPEDIRPEDIGPEDISGGEERPVTVVRPTRLQELVGSVAYNSDLSEERTMGVEAAVAHLVFDR
ncbi:hypothetical protein [Salinibacter altiplanensis]|uniref:hypothetical protein n=1 Tax=Salinibacter altiplanensis TaxID=1803181 RepID=UPI000C9EDE13|nr:hypothetical protein [Salinibacter altiplanensis]